MWYSGQKLVLSRTKLIKPPQQTAASYSAGISTLIGTYGLMSAVFLNRAQKTSTAAVTKEKKTGYVPPKTFGEVFQRVGRPALMRVGLGSIAFFCSGVAQTYVAVRNEKR